VGNQTCIVSIAEGSGAAWNTSQLTDLIINADAAVIIYSVSSKASLTAAHEIWKGAKVTKEEMGMWEIFQITLLGNKADLEDEREVSREEGEACAKSMGCTFREGSVKTRINIDESVEELVKKIRTYRDNERIRYERIRKESEKKKGKISMPWKKLFSK
jgi:GTPase KRas protein